MLRHSQVFLSHFSSQEGLLQTEQAAKSTENQRSQQSLSRAAPHGHSTWHQKLQQTTQMAAVGSLLGTQFGQVPRPYRRCPLRRKGCVGPSQTLSFPGRRWDRSL